MFVFLKVSISLLYFSTSVFQSDESLTQSKASFSLSLQSYLLWLADRQKILVVVVVVVYYYYYYYYYSFYPEPCMHACSVSQLVRHSGGRGEKTCILPSGEEKNPTS